jgi:pyruvate formate lyase activating enzyme
MEHEDIPGQTVTPEDIVEAAARNGCESISYTYTEPTIFFEFAYDCAKLAHRKGIKNVFVSNGFTPRRLQGL